MCWEVSVTLDGDFCINALERALVHAQPEMFNADQGVQFTSMAFTERLKACGIHISMDGRGRALDNIFVERLWWTVKHEWVYLRPAANGIEQKRSLAEFFDWYNRASEHPSVYVNEGNRLC
jgi:putative transposase